MLTRCLDLHITVVSLISHSDLHISDGEVNKVSLSSVAGLLS